MKTGFYFLLIGVFAGLILIFPPIKKPKKPVSHAQKGVSYFQKGVSSPLLRKRGNVDKALK